MLIGVTGIVVSLKNWHTRSERLDDRRRDFRGAGKAIRHYPLRVLVFYSIEHRSGPAILALLGITNGLGGSNIIRFVKQLRNQISYLLINGILASNIS